MGRSPPPPAAPASAELRREVEELKPNYLCEVLALFPLAEAPALFEELKASLQAVEDYPKIPYYSRQLKKFFPLFDSARIDSRQAEARGEGARLSLAMRPFGAFSAAYSWSETGESLGFRLENSSGIAYHGVTAVQPGKMIWRILLYRSGERMVFYALGCVRAFDMFGALRDRLEPSFVGRTEAFFDYMRGRLQRAKGEL